MLRWILTLAVLCTASAALGFGQVMPVGGGTSGLFLAVFALSATLLIGSFEAYETRAVKADHDEP